MDLTQIGIMMRLEAALLFTFSSGYLPLLCLGSLTAVALPRPSLDLLPSSGYHFTLPLPVHIQMFTKPVQNIKTFAKICENTIYTKDLTTVVLYFQMNQQNYCFGLRVFLKLRL
jgi:hypothetical protein